MHCLNNTPNDELTPILNPYHLLLEQVKVGEEIPHSFWGAPEAGRLGSKLYARPDTPVHSILHETAHFICMEPTQRTSDEIDAKGSAIEECACCYLQIVLSDYIAGVGRNSLMQDMNQWGYSFRLGSAQRWFSADSEDAQQWLVKNQILTTSLQPTWQLR